MNCPSRNDDTADHPEYNQSPAALNSDLTTRQDLNGIANAREQRSHRSRGESDDEALGATDATLPAGHKRRKPMKPEKTDTDPTRSKEAASRIQPVKDRLHYCSQETWRVLVKYAQFVGPGFLISVAYIDPGNYATDVAAGADTKFGLLFVVLMSNLIAIFLQSLCIKLGSVTGLNLAENCRLHLPRWLTLVLYLFIEAAIIATDIAEVCLSIAHSVFNIDIDRRSLALPLRSIFYFIFRLLLAVQ